MARLLLLARHFPPFGGAGVHRTLASVRYLPEHGYQPIVVTGPIRSVARNRWEPIDAGLADRIPAGTRVHRVTAPEPGEGRPQLDRAFGRRSPLASWWVRESVRLACEVGRDADVVVASCAPYETAYAGARVASAIGRPWVADLEDAWALDEMRVAPTALHRAVDVRRMRRALATASAIVMASPEAAARVRRAWPELAARVCVVGVPIGFEPSLSAQGPRRPPDGVFRILHAGSLHTDFGERLRRTRLRRRLLGAGLGGLDVLTRSHVFIAAAVARAVEADRALAGRIELHLAGDLTAHDHAVVADRPFVRTHGHLSHAETVDLARATDLLFLPMHDLPPGVRAGLIPFKTYDYLAAGRPILAAVPDGDVRDMLEPLANATVVRPADVEAMAGCVRDRVAAAAAAGGREPDVEPPGRYECRQSVARIAALLDEVGSGRKVAEDCPFVAPGPR